jgi:transposase
MGDFFSLFWDSWVASFRKKRILKPFFTTGMWLKNRIEIIKRSTSKNNEAENEPAVTENEWIRIERVLRAAIGDKPSTEAKKLSTEMVVENHPINLKNQGLRV